MKKKGKETKSRHPAGSRPKQQYPPDWVPIKVPENLEELYQRWVESDEPNAGICFQCGQMITCEADLIPGTNSHNCEAGRALEETIRAAEAAEQNRKPPEQPAKRKSSLDPSGSNPTQDPQVGVFFYFNRQVITDLTPLSQGTERYGDLRIHAKGHIDYWAELQAAGTVPNDIPYQYDGAATY